MTKERQKKKRMIYPMLGFILVAAIATTAELWTQNGNTLIPTDINNSVNATYRLYENGSRVCTATNGICPAGGGGNLSGTGSTNSLAKWTSDSTLGDSIVTDNTTFIHVHGYIWMQNNTVIGDNATDNGYSNDLCIGTNAQCAGDVATVIGHRAYGVESCTAISDNALCTGAGSMSVGAGATTMGINSITLNDCVNEGDYSFCAGDKGSTDSSPKRSQICLGRECVTSCVNCAAIGAFATNNIDNTANFTMNLYENGSRVCTATNGVCPTGSIPTTQNTTFAYVVTKLNVTDNTNYYQYLSLPLSSGKQHFIDCNIAATTGTNNLPQRFNFTGTNTQWYNIEFFTAATSKGQSAATTNGTATTGRSSMVNDPMRLTAYANSTATGTFTLEFHSAGLVWASISVGTWCKSTDI
jgi:hypothetical protein